MKTIVLAGTNESIVLVSDQTAITPTFQNVIVGSGANMFVLGDRTVETIEVFENITAPDDWVEYKYCFDGATWSDNPNWIAPQP